MNESDPPSAAATKTLQGLTAALAEGGEREAVVGFTRDEPESWSYRRLASEIDGLARGMAADGIGPGSKVVVIGPSRVAWIVATLAVIRAGATVAPVDPQTADDALGHVLDSADPSLVLAGEAEVERVRSRGPDRPLGVLSLDRADDGETRGLRSWSRPDGDASLPETDPGDTAVLFFTSGTTGPPKGVPLTHANLDFQIRFLTDSHVIRPTDRLLVPLPLHHVYPFVVGLLAPLANRLTVILPWALTGPEIADALGSGRATVILGVPRLYEALLTGLAGRVEERGRLARMAFRTLLNAATFFHRRLGLRAGRRLFGPLRRRLGPDLRMLVSGGAALDADLASTLAALGWEVATGYGLTETAPLLAWNPPGRGRFDAAGRPIEGVEIKIDTAALEGRLDGDAGREEGAQLGEILARGPNVFSGYHRLPDATREALTEDGWFHTGDLGYLDDDGWLHVAGRLSTMIVTSGGKNVQPEELEKAYARHRFVEEIAVFERGGEILGLIVPNRRAIQDDGEGGGDDDLGAAVARAVKEVSRSLPSHKRLSDYAVTRETLPKTRLGKPRRHLIAEHFDQARREREGTEAGERKPIAPEDMSAEDRALLDDPAARKTWDFLVKKFGDRRLTPDSDLRLDLGIDSMDWLNLTMDLVENANVALDEEAIGHIETVRDLLQEVTRSGETAQAGDFPWEDPESILGPDQKYWLEPLSPVETALSRLLHGVVRVLMRAGFRVEIDGRERLPKTGPMVLAPNHESLLDPPALGAALDYGFLKGTFWAGWTGIVFKTRMRRRLARLARVVPIDPERAAGRSLALAGAVVKRELNLIWFPEGERSSTGELGRFKPGIGLLLDHYRVPVVPVVIDGAFEALPRSRFLPRPHKIRVTIHNAVDVDTLQQDGEGDTAGERIATALHDHMERLVKKGGGP